MPKPKFHSRIFVEVGDDELLKNTLKFISRGALKRYSYNKKLDRIYKHITEVEYYEMEATGYVMSELGYKAELDKGK